MWIRRKIKAESKQQDAVQIGHTQLLTFPKNKNTSLATAFSQSERRQTGKDSTASDTNEVQPLFNFFFFNYIVSAEQKL